MVDSLVLPRDSNFLEPNNDYIDIPMVAIIIEQGMGYVSRNNSLKGNTQVKSLRTHIEKISILKTKYQYTSKIRNVIVWSFRRPMGT